MKCHHSTVLASSVEEITLILQRSTDLDIVGPDDSELVVVPQGKYSDERFLVSSPSLLAGRKQFPRLSLTPVSVDRV